MAVPLPGLNYVVLDANQLRVEPTVAKLLAEYRATGQGIVLPWTHVFEQSKGSADWFDKIHEHLRLAPEAVALAKRTTALNQEERRIRRPVRDVTDPRNTARLREYLAGSCVDFVNLKARAESLFRHENPVQAWVTKLGDTMHVRAADA